MGASLNIVFEGRLPAPTISTVCRIGKPAGDETIGDGVGGGKLVARVGAAKASRDAVSQMLMIVDRVATCGIAIVIVVPNKADCVSMMRGCGGARPPRRPQATQNISLAKYFRGDGANGSGVPSPQTRELHLRFRRLMVKFVMVLVVGTLYTASSHDPSAKMFFMKNI